MSFPALPAVSGVQRFARTQNFEHRPLQCREIYSFAAVRNVSKDVCRDGSVILSIIIICRLK